jgi:hypothetical protein
MEKWNNEEQRAKSRVQRAKSRGTLIKPLTYFIII